MTWPTSRLAINCSRSADSSFSRTALREMTTLFLARSSLMILNSSGSFSNSKFSSDCVTRAPYSEPGKNARTFSIDTENPPLTRLVITPSIVVCSSNAVSIFSQARARHAFSLDSLVLPYPSSTVSISTSTSSPTLTSKFPLMSLNCQIGISASDFRPALTMTISLSTCMTLPRTTSPTRISVFLMLSSNSSVNVSVIFVNTCSQVPVNV